LPEVKERKQEIQIKKIVPEVKERKEEIESRSCQK
jgi:hypothetical protein